MVKEYKGLYDSYYKKLELYLIRLFEIAKYLEKSIKILRISGPTQEELLDVEGCDVGVKIPPHPFYLTYEDSIVFEMLMLPLEQIGESEKETRQLFLNVWERIKFVKKILGITKFTRYRGETDSDKRLCNEIKLYIKYPEACTTLHSLILGKHPENEEEMDLFIDRLLSYRNFLLDRDIIKNVKTYKKYENSRDKQR